MSHQVVFANVRSLKACRKNAPTSLDNTKPARAKARVSPAFLAMPPLGTPYANVTIGDLDLRLPLDTPVSIGSRRDHGVVVPDLIDRPLTLALRKNEGADKEYYLELLDESEQPVDRFPLDKEFNCYSGLTLELLHNRTLPIYIMEVSDNTDHSSTTLQRCLQPAARFIPEQVTEALLEQRSRTLKKRLYPKPVEGLWQEKLRFSLDRANGVLRLGGPRGIRVRFVVPSTPIYEEVKAKNPAVAGEWSGLRALNIEHRKKTFAALEKHLDRHLSALDELFRATEPQLLNEFELAALRRIQAIESLAIFGRGSSSAEARQFSGLLREKVDIFLAALPRGSRAHFKSLVEIIKSEMGAALRRLKQAERRDTLNEIGPIFLEIGLYIGLPSALINWLIIGITNANPLITIPMVTAIWTILLLMDGRGRR